MQIATSHLDELTTVLTLDGRLNMVSAPRLRDAVNEAVESGRSRVVVDLTAIRFMDSSGLGALIAGLKHVRQQGGDLRITGANQQVTTVLQLTNLDRVLSGYPSVREATDGW